MKRINFLFFISIILIITFVSTACNTSNEVIDETSTASPLPESNISLRVWADPNIASVLRTHSSTFESDYGVKIIIEDFGFGAILTNFLVAAPAGEGPDVIVGSHDWLGELVSNGLLAPIDLGDKVSEYAPSSIKAFSYNTELYGLPYMTENVGLFRNTDLIPDRIETWDEVIEISKELTKDNTEEINDNKYGFLLAGNDAYHFFPMMTSYGGYVFGQNENGTYDPSDIGIGNQGTIQAATVLDSMIEDNLIPPSIDGQTILDWFVEGKVGLMISGPWNLPRIHEAKINYTIDPIPTGYISGRPFLGSGGFMVNAFSKNQLLAQIYVTEFVGTPELMKAFYDIEPRTPAYLPVLNSLDDPDIKGFALAGQKALPMPAIPEMGSVWQSWINALTLVTQQTENPASAFETAADQIAAAISGEPIVESEKPDYISVNIPGTAQTLLGCSADWSPDCSETALTLGEDGLWRRTIALVPAGQYEAKVAINDTWDLNYGVDGTPNGDNIPYSVDKDSSMMFVFDPKSNKLDIKIIEMVNISGTIQTKMGCDSDWSPNCVESALSFIDNGTWDGTFDIPAGNYEVKVTINGTWDINYGVNGKINGDNIPLNLDSDTDVTFTFDPATNLLTISTN